MTARVLVVDDRSANLKLLEARLTAEYFEVKTCDNGPEAIEICHQDQCDVVLLDVMMPEMDGFEVCRRLKNDPATMHIPVIMVTALDQAADRLAGLNAGADDFLTKPVNDIALITRVRSLARLKMLTDELRLRSDTGREMGLEQPTALPDSLPVRRGSVLLVDDRRSSYERLAKHLSAENDVVVETDPQQALFRAADEEFELVVASLSLRDFDGLRLCSQLRSLERTRMLPLLIVCEPDENARLLRGLDIGVNDYLMRPIDKNEALARVRTQIRRKRYTDRLRDSVQQTIELAVTDTLTGLHNRRYLENHLTALVAQSIAGKKDLSVLVLDIDHFKIVNDTYGHDVGDEVLKEFSQRISKGIRGVDLACRMGGEEFVVAMPEINLSLSYMIAERLRTAIASRPFICCGGSLALDITVSIGISSLAHETDKAEVLLKRADVALYQAKDDGRNRVVGEVAA
jgi:two-component system cell cycle response regulator